MKKNLIVFLICIINTSFAQDAIPKKETKKVFDRIAWLGTDFKGQYFLYMDGPRILFKINNKVKLGPTFFPSLFYSQDKKDFSVTLGAGVRIDVNRISIGLPMYRIEDTWRPAFGIGFKF